ncbi:CRTAC1 family protein [Tritonibacter scottomollicae]|uniref:VCBS repeat protein n=1 Tax=Tritonibacter scottomollicae TaxID=483013 RepID=A0A2T1ALQ4_TRISK|nr:CRTAC1 family protein [Tritonibacter scottomollicae]PRZ49504.1 VCBS repeat protein [Tritonibacter scottomollicae]
MLPRSWIALTAVICVHAANADTQTPSFTPVAMSEHIYGGGWEHYVGGGLAVFDCNGDGLPELYAAGGENTAQLFQNTTPANGASVAFTAETPASLALTGVTGAYPLDIDGDGWTDLAILRAGPDLLMQGTGECQFQPFDHLGFVSDDHWTTGFSATWEGDNTLPTLAFGTYVDRQDPNGPFGTCDDTLLYRPDGETYQARQSLAPGYCALSVLFSDWNRTGHADLRLSNDRHYYVRGGQEQMWAMEDTPRLYTTDEGWRPYALWGMGIASRDINGDGFQDVYLTSMGDQKFQLRDAKAKGPVWEDVTYGFGTTAHRPYTGGDGRPSTGWHAAFGDVNNDGRDDIFVTKGNVEQMPDAAQKDPNNLMLQNVDGTFSEVGDTAGVASLHRGRGGALVDLNRDGLLDIAVVNRRAQMEVWENTSDLDGNWLLLRLRAAAPNPDAIGAFVEVKTQDRTLTREITVGGGHAGGDLGDLHFGLGQANTVDLRVTWPDGTLSNWQAFHANQHITLSPQDKRP